MKAQEKEYRAGLENVVKALNAPAGELLRELVGLWQASGPNTAKFVIAHPDIYIDCQKAWRPGIRPTKGGHWVIDLVPRAPEGLAARTQSFVLFNSLLANPLWTKLGGPCFRCKKYFVAERERSRKTDRKTGRTYCSRECAWRSTAGEQRDAAREDKLARAKAAITAWRKQHEEPNWKRYVTVTTGIDPRFLTQAVNIKKDLKEPK
jgi:hypothetical protein